jgi:hypothetical protein
MISSWQVPVAILAVIGLFDYLIPALSRWLKNISLASAAAPVFILLVLPTNLYLLAWRFVDLRRYDYPYFLYRDEVEAMEWLEDNTQPDSVILSAYDPGQYIPGISGRRAFLAHWAQTLDFYEKQEMVAEVFARDVDDQRRREILQKYSVDYIMSGRRKKDWPIRPADRSILSENFLASRRPLQGRETIAVIGNPIVALHH